MTSLGNDRAWHLNLYAMREDGVEVLMTQDHILPSSLGGGNQSRNLQTMCHRCNERKGNKVPAAMSAYAGA
jgi:5-methylcytosine-specific restriction endonuclease McrA